MKRTLKGSNGIFKITPKLARAACNEFNEIHGTTYLHSRYIDLEFNDDKRYPGLIFHHTNGSGSFFVAFDVSRNTPTEFTARDLDYQSVLDILGIW